MLVFIIFNRKEKEPYKFELWQIIGMAVMGALMIAIAGYSIWKCCRKKKLIARQNEPPTTGWAGAPGEAPPAGPAGAPPARPRPGWAPPPPGPGEAPQPPPQDKAPPPQGLTYSTPSQPTAKKY